MKTAFLPRFALFASLALIAAGCAAIPSLLGPEDQALKKRIETEVALYSNVVDVSVVDGRVYLTSTECLDSYSLGDQLREEIRQIAGVEAVFNHIRVCGDDLRYRMFR